MVSDSSLMVHLKHPLLYAFLFIAIMENQIQIACQVVQSTIKSCFIVKQGLSSTTEQNQVDNLFL